MCVFSFSSFLYIVYVLFHAFWGALFACLSRNVAWFNWTPTVCLTNPDSDMRGFASWGIHYLAETFSTKPDIQ